MNTVYVTGNDKLVKNENNLIDIRLASGETLSKLEPKRIFPTSNPNKYITFLDEDERQVALLKDPSVLDEESLAALNASLDDYYMVPQIYKINDSYEKYGVLYFDVDTDRGHKVFNIRNRHHDVKTYPDHSMRIRDANDNRYIINNYDELDKKSRSFIFVFM